MKKEELPKPPPVEKKQENKKARATYERLLNRTNLTTPVATKPKANATKPAPPKPK